MRLCWEKLAHDKNSKLRTTVGNTNSEGVSGGRGGQTHPWGLQGEQGLWKPRELFFILYLFKKGSIRNVKNGRDI